MFEAGKLYKHDKCLDTCIRVVNVQPKDGGHLLKVIWLNFRYNMSRIHTEDVFIVTEQLEFWKPFANSNYFNCVKCFDTGSYQYDHNHSAICNQCCKHDEGWWLLENHYGDDNGKWCCKAGCGKVSAIKPE